MRKSFNQAIRRQSSWSWLPLYCVLVLAVCSDGARAGDDVIASPGDVQSGSLLLRMQEGYVIATRLTTDIRIDASGMAARVTLRQSFRNDGQSWVEGLYVFPLPEQSAVDRMRLYIGERYIEGEIREKEQAKKEYEAAKQAGKKASLVKQERANLFTTAVANIAPGEEVTVEIEYQQPVDYRDNLFSLRFPLTMTPRYIPGVPGGDRKGSGWAADTSEVPDASLITPPVVTHATDHRVTLSATINAGMPLDLVASRYHPVTVDETGGQYTLALAGQDVPMDHDLELIWRPHPASAPRALVFSEMHDGQPHLLVMLMPPDDAAAPALAMPRELIFVVDTSGSMHGTSIAQARQALLLALDGLQPSDRFNVIQFNSTTHALFTRSMDASGLHMQQARSYVKGLQANGGTEMRPALEAALRSDFDDNYLRQVIFVTDGSVGNEEALFALIDAELGAARLFTVGIGSAPNGWFMQKAAEAGRGTYTFISALHEVNDRMQGLFRKLERPQLTDINVEWPAGISVDAYPETVPDLYAGEPVLLRARLQRPPGPDDVLLISGDAAVSRWSAAIALQADTESAGIATLWARSRIAELENRRRRGADEETIRKEIIDTALQHHLVSRFTSLVAVDKTPARPNAESLDREQVASLLPHGQSQQAILGFAATATGAPQQRLVGMLCLLLALTVYLTGRRRAWRPV